MKGRLLTLLCAIAATTAMAQWSNDPAQNLQVWPEGKIFYSTEVKAAANGITWLCVYHPQNGTVATTVQAIDSTGVKLLGEEGLLVSEESNRTYTVVNDLLFVDRDGNAIVVVHDRRNAPADVDMMSYTIYKVSPQGEMLWGNEGVAVDGGTTHDMSACMRIIQLEDGSYVFAWMRTNGNLMAIEMQRLSADGEALWNQDEVRLIDNTYTYTYPYLVNAGDNQVILVYARGSNQDIYARKIDFDGTAAWPEDTRIYRGGFGSIPLWTILDVQPSGDGGVIVAWNDDRYYTNIESAYLSYVKPNGQLGFTAGEDGQKLGYSGMRALSVAAKYDPATDSFIAFWRECDDSQAWYSLVAQRVSKQGELLWNEEGLVIEPLQNVNMAYNSLQNGPDGEMAFFYMISKGFGSVTNHVQLLNTTDGSEVWSKGCYSYTDGSTEKATLRTTSMVDDKFWVTMWIDNGVLNGENNVDRLYMQRVNHDRTVGNPAKDAVKAISNDNTRFTALSTAVAGDAHFVVTSDKAQHATLTVCNLQGKHVATLFDGTLQQGTQHITWNNASRSLPRGVYMATLATAGGRTTVKLFIK